MDGKNITSLSYFILMGLTDSEDVRVVLFSLFLLIYLITVLGNAGMVLLICLDPQLHTPMYFFLSHLSFLDLNYSTVITPKTLEILVNSPLCISFVGCLTQMYFFISLVATECFFLSSMAYDRYVAICNPLHYPVVMSITLCRTLITTSYVIGFSASLAIVLSITTLPFCKSNIINHFFCDTTPILILSCTSTHDIEILIFILAGSTLMVSLLTISVSYMFILTTILKMKSASGKRKAFSTCASHFLGVTIFFATTIFTYLKPSKSYSLGKDQIASVFYTIVIPMLNPLIYSLRNKDVKEALIRVTQKRESVRHLT
ncbi:olfactory receptor 8H1-like [Rhynchocyon petersi]